MGFMDKVKAGVKNADNRLGQEVDAHRFDSKISDQKNLKKKSLADAADIIFAAYCNGEQGIPADAAALFDKAKECDAEVERLEAEKAEMIAKAEAERKNNSESA